MSNSWSFTHTKKKLTSGILTKFSLAGELFNVCWSGTAGRNVGTCSQYTLPSSREEGALCNPQSRLSTRVMLPNTKRKAIPLASCVHAALAAVRVQREHQSFWSREGKIQAEHACFLACITRRQCWHPFAPDQVRMSMTFARSDYLLCGREGQILLTAASVCLRDNWPTSFKNRNKVSRRVSRSSISTNIDCIHNFQSALPRKNLS